MIDRRMMITMISAEMSAMVMMIIITVVSKDGMKENGQPAFNY